MTAPAEVEALWRASSARLKAWFARETRDEADAEDLLQETFVRVHERLDTLHDATSVGAWVRRIAHNVLVDHRRRRGLAGAPSSEAPEPAAREADEARDLERTVAGWLEDFLRELAPEDAEALRAADLEGKSQAELAQAWGLSVSGAKSRVQRARARLRARLEACCAFAFDARGGIVSWEKRAEPGRCAEDGCGCG